MDIILKEKGDWQLLHIVFTAIYLLRKENAIIRESFEQLEANPSDFQDYKTVLEIITIVLQRCFFHEEEPKRASILIDDDDYSDLDTNRQLVDNKKSEQNNAGTYIVEVSDMDYLRRITEGSDNSHPEDEDDDLLK